MAYIRNFLSLGFTLASSLCSIPSQEINPLLPSNVTYSNPIIETQEFRPSHTRRSLIAEAQPNLPPIECGTMVDVDHISDKLEYVIAVTIPGEIKKDKDSIFRYKDAITELFTFCLDVNNQGNDDGKFCYDPIVTNFSQAMLQLPHIMELVYEHKKKVIPDADSCIVGPTAFFDENEGPIYAFSLGKCPSFNFDHNLATECANAMKKVRNCTPDSDNAQNMALATTLADFILAENPSQAYGAVHNNLTDKFDVAHFLLFARQNQNKGTALVGGYLLSNHLAKYYLFKNASSSPN